MSPERWTLDTPPGWVARKMPTKGSEQTYYAAIAAGDKPARNNLGLLLAKNLGLLLATQRGPEKEVTIGEEGRSAVGRDDGLFHAPDAKPEDVPHSCKRVGFDGRELPQAKWWQGGNGGGM